MEKYKDKSYSPQQRAEDIADRLTTEQQAEQLKYNAPPIPELGIPSYNWWSEGLHGLARAGSATMFPQAIGLAAMFDEEAVHRVGEITSTEARAKYNAYSAHGDRDIFKGLTLWSPNINIFRDPRWGRGQETFGEDPFLTARLGVAMVKGLQGEGEVLRTAACAKHFAVHSGPEALRHEFDAKVSKKELEETYLPAFEALVREAGVEAVMGAYNCVNGEPSCASEYLMGKLKEWDFDGHFVSDCWAIRDFHTSHGITKTAPESAAMALKAGCDLNCGNTYLHLLIAYNEGLISESDIRRSFVRLMRTRIRLGMMDESTEYDSIPYETIGCREHLDVSLECARKSVVLLKNDGILPIDTKIVRTIGVIGPNADSRSALEGNYNGRAEEYITFLDGIREAFDGRVLFSEGCHLYKDRVMALAMADDRIAEAEIVAENSDLVILCVGLDPSIEGEEGDASNEFSSGDKPDLFLPESQKNLVYAVMKTGKPVIIVTAAGSSVNVGAEPNALVHTWYPGQFGGRALADILFGKVSPSGKLPVTFYKNADELPDFEEYSMKDRTYRFTDKNILYPFGYGLSYGDIRCTNLEYKDGTAYITAENKGAQQTEDVLQLYIKSDGENAVPNPCLCGFCRINLAPGESVTAEIAIPERAFESVTESGERVIEGDKFTIYAGTSQPDALSESLTGKKCLQCVIKPL